MIQVSYVPKEYINTCWKEVEGYLKKATDYTKGRYEVHDLYLSICKYDYHLWIAFDKEEIKGAVVTNITQYPRKKYVCMAFCGGKELVKWKDQMLDLLRKWAKDNGCSGIEATGRRGWAKSLQSQGHKSLWESFELPLEKD